MEEGSDRGMLQALQCPGQKHSAPATQAGRRSGQFLGSAEVSQDCRSWANGALLLIADSCPSRALLVQLGADALAPAGLEWTGVSRKQPQAPAGALTLPRHLHHWHWA